MAKDLLNNTNTQNGDNLGKLKRYEFDKKRTGVWQNDKNVAAHRPKVID